LEDLFFGLLLLVALIVEVEVESISRHFVHVGIQYQQDSLIPAIISKMARHMSRLSVEGDRQLTRR
jgi:hypothetical protein